ncbi:MAG: RNA methyltransferase [Clostridia bacterium]|nr:RNA methyltransferase [Clostridia bacterium]
MDNFLRITAKDNPLIKLVCGLQSSAKERRKNGLFVLEGLRICKDAYENGIRFDKLIISDTAYKKLADYIKTLSEISEKCYLLPDNLFSIIASTDSPQGIIAVAKIGEKNSEINKKGRYIALENLSDPSNLGAISRTAEALGITGILISGDSCDPYSPKALRASMGTLLRIPLIICDNLIDTIKDSSLNAYACVVDSDAKPITSVNFTDGDVVIIGNEANGLTDYAKSAAKERITIPMNGKAESLNAAAAAAISMWEMIKQ